MKLKLIIGLLAAAAITVLSCTYRKVVADNGAEATSTPTNASTKAKKTQREVVFLDTWDGVKVSKSDEAWKKELDELEFYVLRKQGTERAYTGEYTDNKKEGSYYCNACGLALFSSKHKYDSETGWPSFYQPLEKSHVGEMEDKSIPSAIRTEVHCNRCGGHLGHVFDDGPEPTGLRYCINSVSMKFKPTK